MSPGSCPSPVPAPVSAKLLFVPREGRARTRGPTSPKGQACPVPCGGLPSSESASDTARGTRVSCTRDMSGDLNLRPRNGERPHSQPEPRRPGAWRWLWVQTGRAGQQGPSESPLRGHRLRAAPGCRSLTGGMSDATAIVRPAMTASLAGTAIRVMVLFRHTQTSLQVRGEGTPGRPQRRGAPAGGRGRKGHGCGPTRPRGPWMPGYTTNLVAVEMDTPAKPQAPSGTGSFPREKE